MYGVGNKFLAGTAFSANKHRSVAFGNLRNHLIDFTHFVAVADNIGNAISIFQFVSKSYILFS